MQFEKIFNNGIIYNFFQKLIRKKRAFESIKEFFAFPSHTNSSEKVKVLDIGCGPGTYVSWLIGTDYTGIDVNEENIVLARRKYANFSNINFLAGDLKTLNNMNFENAFDVVFMSNVLHHLPKDIILSILPLIPKLLKKNGEFRSSDPVYTNEQSKISKWVMSHDRGKYILEFDDYLSLIKDYFPFVKYKVETDLLRFPFPYPGITCWGYLFNEENNNG
jgi:SAM-dependent methyltransferase